MSQEIDELIKILREHSKLNDYISLEELFIRLKEVFDFHISNILFEMSIKCIRDVKNEALALEKLDSYMKILAKNMKELTKEI